MPALDSCHDQVVNALQKAGWVLESAPYRLLVAERFVYIDLEMSRANNGNRQRAIVIEVKCFPDKNNTTTDLYIAIGQYVLYRAMLEEKGLPLALYLTVPEDVYALIFDASVLRAFRSNQIKTIVVNLAAETVTQWIE